jgi:XTP/dITP diphosphohydrolase
MTEKIVLASNNAGKVRELNALLCDRDKQIVPQSEFALPSVAENGLTFVENALIKARFASEQTGLPALADDSGLQVNALGGQPGIHSARFAGENARDADNCALLLEKMRAVPSEQRQARFYCVLVYLRHSQDPTPLICQGSWAGSILTAPQGENGFGYDPVFYVPQYRCSVAQLSPDVKNQLSHRGQALAKLRHALQT